MVFSFSLRTLRACFPQLGSSAATPLALLCFAALGAATGAGLGEATAQAAAIPYVEGQIIVKFQDGAALNGAPGILSSDYEIDRVLVSSMNLYLVKLRNGLTVKNALNALSGLPQVEYAQADHYATLREAPNDPNFSLQWSLKNSQNKADISALAAWGLGTGGKDKSGSDLVIAIVDGGMDIEHPDLKPNLWTNPGEIEANGKDDDGNGYVDDIHGWNAFDGDGKIPVASHGTHVAGIAAARGNNGLGITGVNWNAKLMAVAAASSTTSVIAAGYGYVIANKKLWIETHGAKGANVVVTNSSFGVDFAKCDSGDFPVWNDLYNSMGKVGILSAAATANLSIDVDKEGDVPTGCSSPYIVKVTNTDNQDQKYAQAGWGLKSIDLGAPGTSIFSTLPGEDYGNNTGTSMATPHVAGAIALLHSIANLEFNQFYRANPAEGSLALKSLMLKNVDQIASMAGVTVSGGRLNIGKAAQAAANYKP